MCIQTTGNRELPIWRILNMLKKTVSLKSISKKTNIASSIAPDLPEKPADLFQLKQFALFDYEQGVKNCDNNPALLLEMLATLVKQQIPTDLNKIKVALATKDYAVVDKLMHKIKGSALYLGTVRMKYACQYVERYWKSGQREWLDGLCQQAVKTIEETDACLLKWLEQQEDYT